MSMAVRGTIGKADGCDGVWQWGGGECAREEGSVGSILEMTERGKMQ